MRRAVPTTSIAIVFHVVVAVMILTARSGKDGSAPSMLEPRAGIEDAVDVGASGPAAGEDLGEILAAPGGAVLVAPRVSGSPRAPRGTLPAENGHLSGSDLFGGPPRERSAPSLAAPATTSTIAVMPPRSIGIGGSNLILPKHESAPPTAHVVSASEKPVADALAEATRSSTAPINGHAVFVVKAETREGNCAVVAIELVDREGSGWDDAKRLAWEKLRGTKLAVPAGTKTALLSIEVTSAYRLPAVDGVTGRLGDNDMPELTLPDPANIGARESRVIAARVVRTTYL